MKAFTLAVILMLATATSAIADWTIEEDFEGGAIPATWTTHDADSDGRTWRALEDPYAHSGSWCAVADCYESGGDDWLITPQVAIVAGDSLIFYARAWYGSEDFEVRLSTQTTSIGDFDHVLDAVTGLGTTYVRYAYDLSNWDGDDCYLAIRWQQDTFAMVVDDIFVGQGLFDEVDAGIVSIELPEVHHLVDTSIFPSGTVKNFGVVEIAASFDILCEIRDALDAIVYSSTLLHSSTLAPDQTEPVTFDDAWAPAVTGFYTVTMTSQLAGDQNPENDTCERETEVVPHFGTGGPDALGYYWIDSGEPGGPVYDWIEISDTGISAIMYGVPTFYADDNMSAPIPIGFDFRFYGIERTHLYVDTNGEILLTENLWYNEYPAPGWGSDGNMFNYSYPIPGYPAMPALVAPYWDDLLADEGVGDVYVQTLGEAPNRYCVIEWCNFRYRYGTVEDTTLTFEAILHENGEMVFQYKDTYIGHSGSICPHDNGRSATVAIQNDTGDIGLCYLREIVEGPSYIGVEPPGNLLQDEMAIRFYAGIDEQPPVFYYEGAGNTLDLTPEFTTNITDMTGVESDSIYYNVGAGWECVGHSSFEEPNIYSFELPEVPAGSTLRYYFAATDNSEAENRGTLPAGAPAEYFSLKVLPTNGVGVLLAWPGTQDRQGTEFAKYEMALQAADVTYDVYDWTEYERYDFSESYSTIFAYANSAGSAAMHDTLSNAMMEFLDYGTIGDPKNLFFASDDFGYTQHGYPNDKPMAKFYSAYLRASYIPIGNPEEEPFGGTDGIAGPDVYEYTSGSVIGRSGSPIGQAGVELPVYSNSPDVIASRACPEWYADEVTNPEISSSTSFAFEDGPFSGHAYARGNACGIWLDNLIYKSFFTSFDISQFTSNDDIRMLISDAVDWFDIPANVADPGHEAPRVGFSLAQNHPNPFSPATTIRYSLPRDGDLAIVIYDASGRSVRTLHRGHATAGAHIITWDGAGDNGRPVGSGIYFCQMEFGEFAATRKMIMMK